MLICWDTIKQKLRHYGSIFTDILSSFTDTVGVTSKLADSDFEEEEKEVEDDTGPAASASRAAVLSGAIILALLLIQAALCVFYIKKV